MYDPPDPPGDDLLAQQLAAAAPSGARDLQRERVRNSLRVRLFDATPQPITLGGYTLGPMLGSGGMGLVHLGTGRAGRLVALKTLKDLSPAALLRLKGEFRCVAALGHDNLAAVHELALDPARGEWFIAMEYVPGVMWDQLPRDALRDAFGQLASGVHALHRAGILHRDLKPSNVLVTPEGRVKIVDFGLALAADSQDVRRAGTPGYFAPERLLGAPASSAADWYAVGVMLFEALSGARLVDAPPPQPVAPDLPDLESLARALLAPRPEDRPTGDLVLRRLGLAPGPAPAPTFFVGRGRELAACARALDRVPALLLIEGPSGAGKSALLARLAADLRQGRGARVLAGRCYAGDSVPYKALDGIVDALIEHLCACPREHVESLLAEESGEIARLFPAFARVRRPAPARPGEDPLEARRRAVAALRRLLAALAREAPLALVIDDLQWGDADSARLLAALLAAPDPPPVLLAATVRAEDRASAAFFRELGGVDLTCPIHPVILGPLDAVDARALAVDLLRAARPDDPALDALAASIARESQGSPLFIEAMSQHLAAAGPAPPLGSLERTLQAQLAGLEPPARRALARLALAGRPLPRDLALPAHDDDTLPVLRARRLVRAGHECDTVETYHDRVREAVLRALAPDERRHHHRSLAEDLAALPDPDPEELATHFHGAGDRERASAWALRAADRAAAALAFARAADLYDQALSWYTFPIGQVLNITLARADALVHAGRCAEAAPAFLAAAALAPDRLQELALRGRAVEQYLVSGRVEDGLTLLRPLARELGLPFPASAPGTVAHFLGERLRLRLRRGRFDERPAEALDPAHLVRLDICWSIGKGLGFIDPIRAAAISAHGLYHALAHGDPRRIARAAAYFSLIDINAPDPERTAAGTRALIAAQELAARVDDPHLSGLIAILSGVAAMNKGRWRRALVEIDAGAELLRARCVGVMWERSVAQAIAMHSLLMLGDFDALAVRAETSQRESLAVGDRFSAVVAILYSAHVALAADDVPGAREAVRKALSLWTYDRFSFQHWLALGVEVACDLLDGRPLDAWARVDRAWPAIGRSQLTRMRIPRIETHLLRANTALAAAAADPARRDALVLAAARDAAALAREHIDFARAAELLVRAQTAALRREPGADDLLAAAADGFTRGDMPALAAALRRRVHPETADRELARASIRAPARWARTVAPALRDLS